MYRKTLRINLFGIEPPVEEALRLREKLGGEITALSMGVPAAQRMLRDVLALGVDRAVLLTDRAFAGSDTLATATALSAENRARISKSSPARTKNSSITGGPK